jgi:hypothetical protein
MLQSIAENKNNKKKDAPDKSVMKTTITKRRMR